MIKADLHIHSVLSACADLEMSPENIILEAKKKDLGIIGITDHNSTYHAKLIAEIGTKHDIFVLMGVEVTTKEDVHCLAFFENEALLNQFQKFINNFLPKIKNKPDIFGYQPVLDASNNIVRMEEYLLSIGLTASINKIEKKVHELHGIFIPAHINKSKNGLIHHLGFVPDNLNYEALELSRHISKEEFKIKYPYLKEKRFIQSSDAHFINDIGSVSEKFSLYSVSFSSIKEYLKSNK